MDNSVFSELSLIIAVGAGVALFMRLIRQPLIIGHIITGIIVGPSVFHLVRTPDTIETFASIGIALLLFIIGLGLNPKVISEVGKVAGLAGVAQVGLTALFGWSGSKLLGFSDTEALFIGVALSFSSTIIILKLLSDKKEQSRLYGKITVGILLVQDFLAAIALLVMTAKSGETGLSLSSLAQLSLKGFAIALPLFLISGFILPKMHKLVAGSQEFLFLFAIGWGFGWAALFESSGFSLEVGALLAGISLAALPYAQEIGSRLRPLRDFFVVVFFISLGTRLGLGEISNLMPFVAFGLLTVIVIKPLVVLATMGLMGYTKRSSFKTASSLAQVSEFSLVFAILGGRQGLVSEGVVAMLTIVALITIAYSTYIIIYADKLYKVFERYLSLFERKKVRFEQKSKHNYELVLFGYQKGGHEFLRVFQALGKRFVVIDYDPEVMDTLEHSKIDYLYGDATDVELLEEAGLEKAKLVVSTITDHETNTFLVKWLDKVNPDCVVLTHAESVPEAEELYELGASYVMMPHYIGSEKIGAFIRKSELKKSEFRKYREKHMAYLQEHYASVTENQTETQ